MVLTPCFCLWESGPRVDQHGETTIQWYRDVGRGLNQFALEHWSTKYEVLGDLQPGELVANEGLLGELWALAPYLSFKSVGMQTA